ncbi:MAG: AAA family ATPase [Candidatus Paceibacterota bacterium]
MKNLEENKYVVMCVGFTHSGKTTFTKKLYKKIKNTVLLDNDEIANFINLQYKDLVFSSFNHTKKNYKDPGLKFLLSKQIFEFSLRAGLNLIQASCNLGKDAQSFIKKTTKKYNYKLITVYFNLPEKVLIKRIKNTKKDTRCFRLSLKWNQVLEKQKLYMNLPPDKNTDVYFEIKNNQDSRKVLSKLIELLN